MIKQVAQGGDFFFEGNGAGNGGLGNFYNGFQAMKDLNKKCVQLGSAEILRWLERRCLQTDFAEHPGKELGVLVESGFDVFGRFAVAFEHLQLRHQLFGVLFLVGLG